MSDKTTGRRGFLKFLGFGAAAAATPFVGNGNEMLASETKRLEEENRRLRNLANMHKRRDVQPENDILPEGDYSHWPTGVVPPPQWPRVPQYDGFGFNKFGSGVACACSGVYQKPDTEAPYLEHAGEELRSLSEHLDLIWGPDLPVGAHTDEYDTPGIPLVEPEKPEPRRIKHRVGVSG